MQPGKKFVGVSRRIPDAKQLQEWLGALGIEFQADERLNASEWLGVGCEKKKLCRYVKFAMTIRQTRHSA